MSRIKVVVAGGGRVAQLIHLPTLLGQRELVEVAGVADPIPAVRGELETRFGLEGRVFSTVEELFELEADALVCATPIPLHVQVVHTALDAGLHVLCEKPLALTIGEHDELAAARDRAQRVVQVGYNKRYDPSFRTLLELLPTDPGDVLLLGVDAIDPMHEPFVTHTPPRSPEVTERVLELEARQLQAELGPGLPPEAYWAYRHGYLSSLVHDVNLVHGILDAIGHTLPAPVTGGAFWAEGTAVSMEWELENGARAEARHVALAGVPSYEERLRLLCVDRILELTYSSPFLLRHPATLVERRSNGDVGVRTTVHHTSFEDSFSNQLLAFHAAVTDGAEVQNSIEASRLDVEALRAAHEHACATKGLVPLALSGH